MGASSTRDLLHWIVRERSERRMSINTSGLAVHQPRRSRRAPQLGGGYDTTSRQGTQSLAWSASPLNTADDLVVTRFGWEGDGGR